MARTKAPDIGVARTTGVVRIAGKVYRYTEGRTRVRSGHPLLAALPDRFEPLRLDYEETVLGAR